MADKYVRIKTSTNNYVWVKEGSVTQEELDTVKNNLINEIKVVSDSLKDYAKIEDLNDVAEQSKEYTDNQIKTIRENHFIIIDELPTPSKDYVGNIYLVANPDDTYGEYIIIEDNGEYKWEAIGTTQISDDFRVDDALSDTSINPVQNKVIKEALEGKLDKFAGEAGFLNVYAIKPNGENIKIRCDDQSCGVNNIVRYVLATKGDIVPSQKGVITTNTPTLPYQAANKLYVDTALEDKVDKVTDAVYYNRVYGIDGKGEQKVFGMGFEPYQYRLAQYMPSGTVGEGEGKFNATLKVGTPIVGNDATNKSYVDKGMWLPAYDETVTYAKDVMVIKDGKIYKSLIDDNIGNLGNTETEATSWENLLSGKLDKKLGSAGYNRVYGFSGSSSDLSFTLSQGISYITNSYTYVAAYAPNTDWKTDTSDKFKAVLATGMPQYPMHCANKKYVDEQIASVKKYYIHKLYFTIDSSGESLYVDVIDSSATKYTSDAIADGSTAIHNYKPIACSCSIRSESTVAPATLHLQSGQLSATVFNNEGTLVPNTSITFVRDDVYEL